MSTPTLQTPKGRSSQQRSCQGPKQTAPLQLMVGKHVFGPSIARAATTVLSANIPRTKPGDGVPRHAALATGNRTVFSFG